MAATELKSIKLLNTSAAKLSKGCDLKRKIDDMEEDLAKIKADIGLTKAGKYYNAAGDNLVISEREIMTDPDPHEVYKALKKIKKGNYIWAIVKVTLKEAKKLLGDKEIEAMRKKVNTTLSWSWKK